MRIATFTLLKMSKFTQCSHSCHNTSVHQTLDELEFERGIWYAAQHNDILKVKKLIEHTTDVDAEDNYGYTALHYASRNGHLEMCKFLISNGANVNALTKSGKVSPLHRCASMGHSSIFKLLLEAGASIDVKDKDKKTVLHRAVEGGHYHLVEEILKISPSLSKEVDSRGHTAKEYIKKSKEITDLFNKYIN